MKRITLLKRLRQTSQILFFFLFLYLLLMTRFMGNYSEIEPGPIRLNQPVRIFLEFDPLIALGTLLSTHSIYKGMLWALAIVAATMVFGRFFCGWACPMGALHHFISYLYPRRKHKQRIRNNSSGRYQHGKYYLLIGLLIMALLTSLQVGLLDPISLLIRSLATAIFPALGIAFRGLGGLLGDTGFPPFQWLAGSIFYALSGWWLGLSQPHFHGGWFIGSLFVILLLLNRSVTRFWCRFLCPLGALLGLFSKFSLLGLEKDPEKCTGCNACLVHCQGADGPQQGVKWRSHDCTLCLNCESACDDGAIGFRFLPSQTQTATVPDLQRRRIVMTSIMALSFPPLSRASDAMDANPNPRLLRPPGSVHEKAFLARCVRCGECMKVCPTHALHPTLFEAGVEGIWSPILIPRIGYCEYECVLCGTVCPTGAIRHLTETEKKGTPKKGPVVIGTAFIDRGRCLPWAMGRPCVVCEEHCPTDPKAIFLRKEEAFLPKGQTLHLQRPYIEPIKCVGCGICETRCPVSDPPAVYVTRIGESRSVSARFLLEENRIERNG